METKGSAIASIPEFVKNRFGEDGFRSWLRSLPGQAHDVYSFPINLNVWYPLIPFMSVPTRVICDLFFKGDISGASEAGRFSADFALHGIYRLFVKIGSVDSLIKRASVILPTYYRPSAIEVVENRKNRVVLRIVRFDELDAIIERRITGWMQRAVEIAGGKSAETLITSSLTQGANYTEIVITWN